MPSFADLKAGQAAEVVKHAIAPAYFPVATPTSTLPGSGGPDHPGVVYNQDGFTVSQNWIGGGVGERNIFQTIERIPVQNGLLKAQMFTRDSYDVQLNYGLHPNTYGSGGMNKGYYGSVHQIAETDNADPGTVGHLGESNAVVFTDKDGKIYTQLTSLSGVVQIPDPDHLGKKITVNIGNLNLGTGNLQHPDNGILYLQKQDPALLTPEQKVLKAAVMQAENNADHAFHMIHLNLTNGQGGPPVRGLGKDYATGQPYQAAMQTPWGTFAQYQDAVFYMSGFSMSQINSSANSKVFMQIEPNGLERAASLMGHGKDLPLPFWVQNISLYKRDGTTETYDPREQKGHEFSGALSEKTYAGGQPHMPADMVIPVQKAVEAFHVGDPVSRQTSLSQALLTKGLGTRDCPPEGWWSKVAAENNRPAPPAALRP